MKRFTEALGKEVTLRENTSDEQTWIDTFQELYHVPPVLIDPDTVLDLGANIGLTAAHYQAMWPDARVYAVEMDYDNALACQQNFGGPLTVAAVGVESGEATYIKSTWNWEASYSLMHPGEQKTRVIALSEILDRIGLKIDFCKMDIEGSEWPLFAAPEGWASRISSMVVELHGDDPPEEMVMRGQALLEAAGYTVEQHRVHWHALWATR